MTDEFQKLGPVETDAVGTAKRVHNKTGTIPCLSAEAFRAIAKEKGWTMVGVGIRWGLTKTRMSQIVNDPQRRIYYDDAVRGLPNIRKDPPKKRSKQSVHK